MSSKTGKAGVIVAPDEANNMDKLAHSVLDDLLYNIVHDLLVKTHRDEKMARAATAAIRVEKLASDASDSSTPDSKPDVRIETDSAIYEDGKVMLKGNPLKTTTEILCPRCHLPRLLHPTDGKGARKPDPSIIYCKRHPYVDKPGYDIYGQTWVAPGPGRGKKKKELDKRLDGTIANDSPGLTPVPEQRPPNVLSFPSATCSKCKRCILVTRLNNHMGSCIGNSGRNASRAAAQKISNGSNANSQGEATPPSSQKGTPLPGSRAGSPRKRDGDEFDEGDESDPNPKKKKKQKLKAVAPAKNKPTAFVGTTVTAIKPPTIIKPPTPITKKVILKTKVPPPKKERIKANSSLGVELKTEKVTKNTPVPLPLKKGAPKLPSPAKKLKLGTAGRPPLSSPVTKNGRDPDEESESSGTLSSPPQ